VELAGVFNARHTGGLTSGDGRRVRDRAIIRSGHLAEVEATGCGQLAALPLRTVIDLRQADGSTGASQNPDADCATTDATYYQADVVKLVPPSVAYYEQTLTALEPKLATMFGHLGRDDGLPAILHCVIGRDRASIATALVLLAVGVSGDDVVQDYLVNHDSSVQGELAAEYMQAVVDAVTSAGGIDAYLQSHGVTATQLSKLEELALEPR
jgi:protein-tyrosine phosphatase